MTRDYDDTNIFARILRGEIPCDKVFEDEHVLAFKDIQPRAPVHVLVIPKGRYRSFADFSANASEDEVVALIRAAGRIAKEMGVEDPGYRLLSNVGDDGGQEVPHLHFHIFGGRALGAMLPSAD
ncbi:histidine triad nucleotide-binding protein [Fodinicurvata sp. EGI_FJ10296]|uniref:histidine triad nucleotide-binding protein n=1 Tax=Fodinicurvata sp. EGI_FJ10296 TaxID=3231908 RepID=UPI003451E39E